METPEVLGILGIPVETGDGEPAKRVSKKQPQDPDEPEEPEENKKKIGILGGGGSGGRNTFNILAGY